MSELVVYTIGHGRQSFAEFYALLRAFRIELVCDVRSFARSRWVQFNGQVLAGALSDRGIGYDFVPECGGKIVAAPADLARGLDRIVELASDVRTAIMCSESQPLTKHKLPRANCHRVGLLAVPLKERGARVIHILPNGEALEMDERLVPSVWSDEPRG